MKRILIAFLSVFISWNAVAESVLHINSNVVSEVFKRHIPPAKQVQALFEYNQIVKERGGIVPSEIQRVCAAVGWQTDFAHAMTDGAKCDAFVEDLLKNASVKMYAVCGKEKGKSGGTEKCINDFQALTTTMIQATGLAKLYVYAKDKTDKVVCSNTPRLETTTVTSNIRGGMNAGMAPATTMNTHYVQCKAIDKNIFYEFKFNNTRGTSDSTNHRNFKTGICSVYGYKLQPATSKDNREKSGWDICENATQNACGMINNGLAKAHSGYVASWGPWKRTLSTGAHGRVNEAGAGYKLDASNLPYCILTANVGTRTDGTAYERTAFGLDGRHFLTSDIRTQGNQELHNYIRKYVESTGLKITEFDCAETYVTVQLKGRSDPDDMITCTINGSTVDFFFDNLSEWKSKYVQGAKQALDCMVSGGTFTGKKCIGLGKEQCEVVRAANAMSCPECKQIKWNSETNICELPASASAAKLKRGLNYTAIVGGAVVGIVITVGTLGTSSAPTIAILGGVGIETAGSVIELIAQMRIDEKADKFFTQSANCKNQTCAEKLIKDYLRELANQSDSLLDSELTTADEEFARLFDLIPSDAEFYTKIVENGIRGETVESNKRGTFEKGSWNSDQIWRAVGIGLQIIPTVASVGWKIAKKSNKLVKSTAKLRTKLDNASKHLDDMLRVGKTNNMTAVATKADDAADAARGTKIANADSPESEAGFEAMMQRVAESNDKKITPEDIRAEYIRRQTESGGKYTSADIEERIDNYKEYYEAHGNGTLDTQTKYRTADGSYTAERQQIHDKILDDLFKDADKAKPAAGEKPTFVMLGGRGGSGKSSLKGLAYDPEKTVVIDADKIKTMLPEYSELFQQQSKYAGLNAWEVHEESSDIVKAALDMAKERGINVVLDGTMSSAGSALKKITPFKNAGYRIEGAYMYLPREESTVRGMGRSMNLDYSDVESGRFVPTDVLLNMQENEKAFGEVSGHFDSWGIWTTEGVKKGEVPNLIGHSEDIGVFERGDDFQKLNNTDIDLTTFGK